MHRKSSLDRFDCYYIVAKIMLLRRAADGYHNDSTMKILRGGTVSIAAYGNNVALDVLLGEKCNHDKECSYYYKYGRIGEAARHLRGSFSHVQWHEAWVITETLDTMQ
jgi:hypothetical protein